MTDLFGVTYRWEGPFANVNYAGPVGVFLLIYGLSRNSFTRFVFVVSGILIMLASEARTSFVAASVGVGVIFLLTPRIGRFAVPIWIRISLGAAGLAAVILALVGPDADLNSRTPLWQTYFILWRESPIAGIGESGINQGITEGYIPGWASHAHSIYLDSLVRYGITGLVLLTFTLVVASWICLRAAVAGYPFGAAIFFAFVVGGATETIIDWRYFSVQGMVLVSAVLLSNSWIQQDNSQNVSSFRH